MSRRVQVFHASLGVGQLFSDSAKVGSLLGDLGLVGVSANGRATVGAGEKPSPIRLVGPIRKGGGKSAKGRRGGHPQTPPAAFREL